MRYLTSENIEEFESKYPDADYFLRRCELKNELRYLLDNEYILNAWQKKRLSELEEWKRNMTIIGEMV